MTSAARTPPFGIATAVALLVGVSTCLRLPTLPWWPIVIGSLAVGVAIWGRRSGWRIVGPVLFGFGLCAAHAGWVLDHQ